ncbi:hypothetical protein [Hyphomicrobium sp. DY-1]|uniref:hypothetical protein n=1 Tax=Hyphomicrobium sp. DY-1 TaxID=3075650 RepID=UPI0039C4BAB6
MRFKAVAVVLGAVAASSFSAPTRLGSGGAADAADAIPPAQQRAQSIKVPEFVPVVNFSEFVLAMQAFAAQNPPAARIAAEELSAKFALNGDAKPADAQQIEVRKPDQQMAAAAPEKPAPVIVTRPVVTASISEAPAEPQVPAVPDPNGRPTTVADPVKIITGYPAKTAETAHKRRKAERKVAASEGRERLTKKYQPAMGLGMVIDSAEEAPPMSSLAQKKSKVNVGSRGIE